jgi:Holliday junction DNA helicase RuvB
MFEKFIGQKKILLELTAISLNLKEKFEGINLMFRGSAGCGKTKLAEMFLSNLGYYTFQLPSTRNSFSFIWDDKAQQYKYHFIDEIHKMKSPETMYPTLDTKKHVFIFASNEYGELPDALLSRCFVYNFEDYTMEEMSQVISLYAKEKGIFLEETLADLFAKYSRNNPRTVKSLFDRTLFIINRGYYKLNNKGITSALNDIGIYNGGYTDLDIKYLQTLSKLGYSSLDNMSRILKIDRNTILNEIEPFLISKGHINISSRGRKFIQWEKTLCL